MIDAGQLHLAELLLSIAGFLILFLLGIIGFWIQKWIRSTDALTEAIQKLEIHLWPHRPRFKTSKSSATAAVPSMTIE
jgi:hypothetical protein